MSNAQTQSLLDALLEEAPQIRIAADHLLETKRCFEQ
jgi:hypothetical protein